MTFDNVLLPLLERQKSKSMTIMFILLIIQLQLKRANSDDALTKPSLGSAAAGSRLKKTVTTGAISDLAEARPRGFSGNSSAVILKLKM